MKKILISCFFLFITFLMIIGNISIQKQTEKPVMQEEECDREICGEIEKGETLYHIFKKHQLNFKDFFKLKEASANIHRLRNLSPGQPYKIILDNNFGINSFTYWIDGDNILHITRTETGFSANKETIEYEKRILYLRGIIKDNLITSIGGNENLIVALQLSDIFSWDIDFNTDLREGDEFIVIVEGLYLDGNFKKYGDILAAELINNGEAYHAYRFEQNGKPDYYDENGKSLRRAFLKTPLSFRRISSYFSKKRFHPILRIYRPHYGLDYLARHGTPVSSVGDGTVLFSGYKGQYGNLVIIRHFNGWKTYYGHLSKIGKNMRKGKKVYQGQVIGYVGATGLATGPHLHYEIRLNNKPVNLLTLKMPRGESISKTFLSEFRIVKNKNDMYIAYVKNTMVAMSNK